MVTKRLNICIAIALLAMFVAGCATFSEDRGFSAVEATVRDRLGKETKQLRSEEEIESAAQMVRKLLQAPLSVDDAEQIALLNNRGIQATYAELGIAEADLVQAGRMTNPHFAFLRTQRGDERKLEWALTFPIIDLLTMSLRTKIEGRRFEETKLAVAGRVLELAYDTRRTYFQAVAAEELVRYLEQVKSAAEASAELARRMARAGNFSRLTQMREQVFYAETVVQLAQAQRAATAQRERLTQLMGLFGEDTRFRLAERLPDLPGEPPAWTDLEAMAIAQRLDIQALKLQTESLAASLGLTRATRFINVLEIGPARTKEDPEPWKRGYEISLQLPIFDWGAARAGKAEELYMQSLHRVAELATNARSEVRDAYAGSRTAWETTKHYRDEIVPLRKKIGDENLLRYNGMLISVFELLADAREQVASVIAYIGSLRDFWLSETDLRAAVNGAAGGGRSRSGAPAGGRMIPNPALAGH